MVRAPWPVRWVVAAVAAGGAGEGDRIADGQDHVVVLADLDHGGEAESSGPITTVFDRGDGAAGQAGCGEECEPFVGAALLEFVSQIGA